MSLIRNRTVLFTGALAMASALAHAQPQEGFTITPSVGYYNMDNKRNVDNDAALSLGLGYQFGTPWALEFVYLTAGSSTLSSGADVDVDQFRLDALYHLNDQYNVTPYLVAGLGSTDFSKAVDLNNTQLNAGAGVKYAINDQISLRGDFRLIKDVEDHHLDNLTTLGLQILFGNTSAKTVEQPEPIQPAPAPAPEKDSDQDGIMDAKDQCPGTPRGVGVNAQGCELDEDNDGVVDSQDQCLRTPSTVSVDAKGCALDEDNDGVADHQDQCLGTPSTVSVNAQGCPLDEDNDGIADHQDQCLGTAAGISVDAKGCALDDDKDGVANHLDACANSAMGSKVDAKGCYETLETSQSVRLDVQFGNNSTEIAQKYFPQIQEVANFLTQYPETTVVIEGHTDDRGAAAYNQSLSEKRAQAIADVLVDVFSVAKERVSAIGYGEAQPIVNNDTASNRNINRRVVAVVSAMVEETVQ